MVQWVVLSVFVLFVLVKTFFYKNIAQRGTSASIKLTLHEAEILMRKHQLQRILGNTDILTEEMNTMKNEIKALRQRHSQYKIKSDKYKTKIMDLGQKIETLL